MSSCRPYFVFYLISQTPDQMVVAMATHECGECIIVCTIATSCLWWWAFKLSPAAFSDSVINILWTASASPASTYLVFHFHFAVTAGYYFAAVRRICFGFRSANELSSKPPCWFTSVCVVMRLRIWVIFVDRFQLFRAVDNCRLTLPTCSSRLKNKEVHWNWKPKFLGCRSSHVEQITCWAEKTRTVCCVSCQALSLQQLLTAACSAFVVTSFLICAVYMSVLIFWNRHKYFGRILIIFELILVYIYIYALKSLAKDLQSSSQL